MKKLEIYDPALCCSTGVCGPSPDAQLTAFASAVGNLKDRVKVARYNLAQQPGIFAEQPIVNQVLHDEGPNALPVILIDGKLAMKGIYPTRQQILQLLDLDLAENDCDTSEDCCGEDEPSASRKSDCCGDSNSCC